MTKSIAGSLDYESLEKMQPTGEVGAVRLADARRRLPLNLFSNLAWLVLNMAVGLWYTPYLISRLGVAVYGLVPLITSITNYLSLLTDGFNSAVSRFLQIEMARGDDTASNRIFNTSLIGSLAIVALILLLALGLAWAAPQVFDVPAGGEADVRWLVLLTMAAFGITFLSSSFAVSSFALSRFDLRFGVNVLRLGVQIGSLVVLFWLVSPRLWAVGVGIVLSALVALAGYTALWRRLSPQLKIRLDLFDRAQLDQMLKFSGWVLVNQAGAQLFLNIDLIVANLIFGAVAAGRYGAVVIFSSLLRSLVGTMDGVLVPIVFTLYAQNNRKKMAEFCRRSVKYVGLTIALPIGLLCGLARPLLTVWLGAEFASLAPLVIVLVSHLTINLAVVPLFSVQVATNHVRLPGILTLVMGLMNAGLAVALALWSGWGIMSIAIAGAIVLTAKNTLFTPLYAARLLKLPWHTFFPSLITNIAGVVIVTGGAFLFSQIWARPGWIELILVGAVVSIIYGVVVYRWGLNREERLFFQTEISRRVQGAKS